MADEYIHSFCEEEESENTKRKTFYDIRVFLEFLHSENEARNIHEIPPIKLGLPMFLYARPKHCQRVSHNKTAKVSKNSLNFKVKALTFFLKVNFIQ